MNKEMDILTNTTFWTSLAQRYFDAESSEAEELVLKSFVASKASYDPVFDTTELELFANVRATMSIIAIGRQTHSKSATRHTQEAPPRHLRWWKWATVGAAASIAGTLLILPSSENRTSKGDICMASVNGQIITDRKEVLSLMHDSWEDIDISSDGSEIVVSQLKEMFGELE